MDHCSIHTPLRPIRLLNTSHSSPFCLQMHTTLFCSCTVHPVLTWIFHLSIPFSFLYLLKKDIHWFLISIIIKRRSRRSKRTGAWILFRAQQVFWRWRKITKRNAYQGIQWQVLGLLGTEAQSQGHCRSKYGQKCTFGPISLSVVHYMKVLYHKYLLWHCLLFVKAPFSGPTTGKKCSAAAVTPFRCRY